MSIFIIMILASAPINNTEKWQKIIPPAAHLSRPGFPSLCHNPSTPRHSQSRNPVVKRSIFAFSIRQQRSLIQFVVEPSLGDLQFHTSLEPNQSQLSRPHSTSRCSSSSPGLDRVVVLPISRPNRGLPRFHAKNPAPFLRIQNSTEREREQHLSCFASTN